jgi:hypothetical protein
VANLWAKTTPGPKELDAIFALQILRVSGAHNLGAKKRAEYLKALKFSASMRRTALPAGVCRWIRSTTLSLSPFGSLTS